ncbi:hypothetical protein [Litorimonas sp. WD9-15]|uniref:hypothetical protein n=1 Tax=Litorimonas sp. WD9-15 TaxID=3418716 RepID=UPI003D016302
MTEQPRIKIPRVIASLVVGAFIGASIACIQYMIGVYQVNGAEYFREYILSNAFGVFVVAFIVWLCGICFFGGPVWFLLHKKKRTHLVHAAFAGFVIPFLIILAMQTSFFTGSSGFTSYYANGGDQVIAGRLTPFGWKMAFVMAFEYACIGAVISSIIWFINYKTRKILLA